MNPEERRQGGRDQLILPASSFPLTFSVFCVTVDSRLSSCTFVLTGFFKKRCILQELTITLGLTAALLHGVAYVLYNMQAKLGSSKPNAASWSVWAFLATLNALSYREMSGDAVMTLQFFTGSVACILTFLYVLTIGKFSRLKPKEWGLFTLGLLATLVWWKFRSATGANMIILVAFLISFIPTFEGVLRDPFKETPRSWMLWTLAFLVTTINVVLRDGKPVTLLTPIVLFLTHGSIALLSAQSRKAKFTQAV